MQVVISDSRPFNLGVSIAVTNCTQECTYRSETEWMLWRQKFLAPPRNRNPIPQLSIL